jgi:hypothetical protein
MVLLDAVGLTMKLHNLTAFPVGGTLRLAAASTPRQSDRELPAPPMRLFQVIGDGLNSPENH